ncbi:MAG: hypothetical protein GY937_10445 [bacterium]|nr:hypothetical protein [bacterium]
MNFAFPVLLVVLLVLPGAIVTQSYYLGNRFNPSGPSPFTPEGVGKAAVWAGALHFLWIYGASLVGEPVQLDIVLSLLLGPRDSTFAATVASATAHPRLTFTYFSTLYFASWAAGHLSRTVVRRFKLDIKYSRVRFSSKWWYLLSGERLFFPESEVELALESVLRDNRDRLGQDRPIAPVRAPTIEETGPPLVFISAIVTHGDKSYVYTGLVSAFSLTRVGTLDTIDITLAHRRDLETTSPPTASFVDRVSDSRYYSIDGNFVVLKYEHLQELNLDYYTLLPEGENSGALPWTQEFELALTPGALKTDLC